MSAPALQTAQHVYEIDGDGRRFIRARSPHLPAHATVALNV